MTNTGTETRNGWGPAAPATDHSSVNDTSGEEQTNYAEEQEEIEEIGGGESEHPNGSGRRVYSPQEEYRVGEDSAPSDSEDEQDPEEDEDKIEEFGHEPEAPPQAPAADVDEDGDGPGEDSEDEEDENVEEVEEEGESEEVEEFSTSQAPGTAAGPQPRLGTEEDSEQQQWHARGSSVAASTGAVSNGENSAASQSQARSRRRRERDAGDQPSRDQPSREQRSREQRSGKSNSSVRSDSQPAQHQSAFDPDAASRDDQKHADHEAVDEQAPARRKPSSEPSSEPSSYGSYGAGSLRRSLAGSLRKLPLAGKLFGSAISSGDGSGHYSSERSAPDNQPAYEGGHYHDDQGIADKPSPQEVERRLALALRETSIDGFSKIAVGSPKGGVGKSSLAYAIGCAIANHTNIRVCLVDADPEFGATRSLVPRPVPYSIVELARDADELHRLSDIRSYVAQNERMRLDVLLNPSEMIHKAQIGDLPAAYERIDEALSRFYDLVIYDMGIGFSHPQIQTVLGLSDELLLVGDSEVVPNDIFADALSYIQGLGFGLDDATLAISHRLPPTDESATTGLIKSEHAKKLRRVTEIPYDASFSQLLNRRAFRVDALSLQTRLGILTTAAASLEGLRTNTADSRKKG